MVFGTSKIQLMLNRLGEPITLGGTTVNGLVDVVDVAPEGPELGTFAGRLTTVVLKTGSLPGLAQGVTLVVRSVNRKVQETRQIEDGELTAVFCS